MIMPVRFRRAARKWPGGTDERKMDTGSSYTGATTFAARVYLGDFCVEPPRN